jgi:integrase
MATFTKRGTRWRALVRKAGHVRCSTFETKRDAQTWATKIEAQAESLRASGVMQTGESLADLIDRYVRELAPLKPWGRTKAADLARLKKDLGNIPARALTSHHLTRHFQERCANGAGPVTVSAQIGYLIGVLEVARTVWHLDVPLQAARDARTALSRIRLVGKSGQRDRRVSDAEIVKLTDYFDTFDSSLPMSDIVRFCVASGMRISEVCRLEWRDLNETERTIKIHDRKHPQKKLGNDMVVPLLNANGFDAFALAIKQRREGNKSPRIFPVNPRTVSAYFTRAVETLKLSDLHLHDLRHEAISRLFAAGFAIHEVALVSGHRDWQQLKRYTHVRAVELHRDPSVSKTARSTPSKPKSRNSRSAATHLRVVS